MNYRIRWEHSEDGSGAVTRQDGQALDETRAVKLADEMRQRDEYEAIVIEVQARPGARWGAS